MKILVISSVTPSYAPTFLAKYLKSEGHDVSVIYNPNRYEGTFIPFISHYKNANKAFRASNDGFDISISPDVSIALAMARNKHVKKSIYWRLDYYPKKYFGPLNNLYHYLDRLALKLSDEIWSISDPEDERVHKTLYYHDKVKYVPFLLESVHDEVPKESQAIFMGPDLDKSKHFAKIATTSCNLQFVETDYSQPDKNVSNEQLHRILSISSYGFALYDPQEDNSKYYSDPSRVKMLLSHGIPIITTRVAPIWRELVEHGAGVVVDYNLYSIVEGLRYCIKYKDDMSKNARELARKYTYSDQWIKL